MPITPTEKIWMNGELVAWDDARIHILTHTLHYGMGVFEGIRAYETDDGPGVFRLTDHIERLFRSAQILGMEIPYTVDELVQATKDTVASTGLPGCYIRPIAYYGYGEMGLNTLPCSVDVSIACWPWGAYLGDDALTKGVRMKISSWTRHDHNTMPPASKTTGNYVNSSLAKVEALKAGYDEALMLNPQGLVAECTGENIFVARGGRLITPPLSAGRPRGHHPGHGDARWPRTWAFDVVFGELTRSDLYVADEMFVVGTAAEVSAPSAPSTTARSPCPGPMTTAIGEEYAKVVRGQVDRYKDWVELCSCRLRASLRSCPATAHGSAFGQSSGRLHGRAPWLTRRVRFRIDRGLRHDAARRRPVRGHLAHGRGQAEGGRAARLARRRLDRGRLPAGQPEGRGVLPAGRQPSCTSRRPRWWPSGPRGGPRARSTSTPRSQALVNAGTSTACIVGKSWDFHVLEALGTTLDEGVAMVAESVAFLKAAGLRVFFDAEHFFDGYKANPEYALRVLEAAATNGADCLVMCDTNGGSLPARGAAHRHARSTPTSGRPAARHPHPERLRLRGRQLGRRGARRGDAAAGHGQRLRRAHRQRQPHDLHPQPRAQDGRALPARGPARAAHRGQPPRGRAGEPAAALGRPLRRHVGVRPQGRPAHLRARQGRRRHLRAHRARARRQRHPGAGERPRRSGRHGDEGQGARRRPRRPRRRPSCRTTSSSWRPRASCSRRPTPASSCSCGRPPAGTQTYFQVEGYRATTYHRAPAPGSTKPAIDTEATVKLWVGDERLIAVGEGNGPVNALDQALRRVLVGAYPHLAHIHLTDYRVRILDTRGRHGRRGPRAHRLHRRRPGVDHDRRVHQHHRGVVAGPHRRARVGPAPLGPVGSRAWPLPSTSRSIANQPVRALRVAAAAARVVAARPAGRGRRTTASPAASASATRARTRATCSRWPAASRASSRLAPGEHEKDALAGAVGVALKRASLFGRAPVVHDLTVALTIWGFLGEAPDDLVELRKPPLRGGVRTRTTTPSCAARRPRPRGDAAPAPRPQVSEAHRADWRALSASCPPRRH